MRLAIEERELNKMAAVMKQDDKMQNLLSKTEEELKSCQAELETEREKVNETQKLLDTEKSKMATEIEVIYLFMVPDYKLIALYYNISSILC